MKYKITCALNEMRVGTFSFLVEITRLQEWIQHGFGVCVTMRLGANPSPRPLACVCVRMGARVYFSPQTLVMYPGLSHGRTRPLWSVTVPFDVLCGADRPLVLGPFLVFAFPCTHDSIWYLSLLIPSAQIPQGYECNSTHSHRFTWQSEQGSGV